MSVFSCLNFYITTYGNKKSVLLLLAELVTRFMTIRRKVENCTISSKVKVFAPPLFNVNLYCKKHVVTEPPTLIEEYRSPARCGLITYFCTFIACPHSLHDEVTNAIDMITSFPL